MFVRQIARDGMLVAVMLAPLLLGSAFRFGIPALAAFLERRFPGAIILAPYYQLFDLFLCAATPYFYCFVSALVMLAENDENMVQHLAVTPVGKSGYIFSRLVFPAAFSFVISVIIVAVFALTSWSLLQNVACSFLASLFAVSLALMLFSLSGNRVEGMALGKLAGVFMLGLPVPFFIQTNAQYLFGLLPSFWIAKLFAQNNLLFFLPGMATAVLWFLVFFRRFLRKLD